jgi:hypothetical protein
MRESFEKENHRAKNNKNPKSSALNDFNKLKASLPRIIAVAIK